MKPCSDPKLLEVWCFNGHDDEGDWAPELFSSYEKAKKAFDEHVEEMNFCYGKYDEQKEEYESVCDIEGDFARYNCGSHHGTFWINKIDIK